MDGKKIERITLPKSSGAGSEASSASSSSQSAERLFRIAAENSRAHASRERDQPNENGDAPERHKRVSGLVWRKRFMCVEIR